MLRSWWDWAVSGVYEYLWPAEIEQLAPNTHEHMMEAGPVDEPNKITLEFPAAPKQSAPLPDDPSLDEIDVKLHETGVKLRYYQDVHAELSQLLQELKARVARGEASEEMQFEVSKTLPDTLDNLEAHIDAFSITYKRILEKRKVATKQNFIELDDVQEDIEDIIQRCMPSDASDDEEEDDSDSEEDDEEDVPDDHDSDSGESPSSSIVYSDDGTENEAEHVPPQRTYDTTKVSGEEATDEDDESDDDESDNPRSVCSSVAYSQDGSESDN
eukprot:c3951_g1_i1.p1 GENE.c3951_g1_i1~~c3951_g1_i1.p1  ORF type:complete len:271 (+),score=55.51 c3951_g1_i1:47-859(+)